MTNYTIYIEGKPYRGDETTINKLVAALLNGGFHYDSHSESYYYS